MVSYSQVRSPISIILFIGSFALFGATGYLIYRTIHENYLYNNDTIHSCKAAKVNSITLEQVSRSTVLVVYHDTVVIVGPDPLQGKTGSCDISTNCNQWSTSGNTLTCTSSDPPPMFFDCWTTADNSSPVCVEPGSMWVGALVGCIICGVFGIGFLLCALSIRKSIVSNPSVFYANNNAYDVAVVYPSAPQMSSPNYSINSQPPVTVVGTPVVVQDQSGGPISRI